MMMFIHMLLNLLQEITAHMKKPSAFHTFEMKMAAAKALAELISDDELSADYIIPKAFDKRVGPAVAKAVAEAARKSGVARI